MSSFASVPGAMHYGHMYDSKVRLASYWHQVDECIALGGKSVLVVGKGSGLPSILLERQGLEVTTADIQPELEPTVICDVQHFPFTDRAFDIAICCQVLEHLPFECFLPSLQELRRVIRRGLVLSLPDQGHYTTLLPRLFRRKTVISLPNFRYRRQVFMGGGHLWEVNAPGYRLNDVQHAIDDAGLNTKRTFRVWEYPYHRFWCTSTVG